MPIEAVQRNFEHKDNISRWVGLDIPVDTSEI